MYVGIDLGTTYSCMAFIDDDGIPKVIRNSDGMETTPSVIWFDGKAAFVGKKANDRKITPGSPIYEFVKRDMGKPKESTERYDVNGYSFGAVGMSAIILRKLKKEAFLFFKKKGLLPPGADEKATSIPAVITVPAYFGDLQRQETRIAGFAAGLDVIAIINEPTAAALAYARKITEHKKIMVFDLGGGTFDISIVEVGNGEEKILAKNQETRGNDKETTVKGSQGFNELGGKDWDDLIIVYLYTEFRKRTGKDIPDDMGWEIQQKALDAKYALTEETETTVLITDEDKDIEITLYRENPNPDEMDMNMDDDKFYFEERSSNLLALCTTICNRVLGEAGLGWGDIDDIVLAGGSCRMHMIPKLLENLSGRRISRNVPGFNYDTAIAIGAAIYASGKGRIKDVTSKAIGVEVLEYGVARIEYLIQKNKLLPVTIEKKIKAPVNAELKVYESEVEESKLLIDGVLRGRLQLGNPKGEVTVTISVNEDGVLNSIVEFPPDMRKELIIQTANGNIDRNEIKARIAAIDIRL